MICTSVLGQSVENHQPVIQVSRVRVMNKEIPTFQIGAGSGRGHELQKSFDGKSWELIRLVPRTAKPSYWFDTNNLSTVTLYQLVENPAEVILASSSNWRSLGDLWHWVECGFKDKSTQWGHSR